jgi:flavin reductase (DIM6/NTAB) family NADH-FMN oxidoreductase RutF
MDESTKKTALRLFTYGLYAVIVRHGSDANAFTANWLTQVSFDPPMVAVSVENSSHSIGLIRATGIVTINVLASGDREVAGALGKRWEKGPTKLAQVPHRPGPNGCAVLDQALAYLECQVSSSAPAGASTVFVATIQDAQVLREGPHLTMAESGFRHAG